MFKLTIEDDEGKTTVIPLIRDEMTIGRQEGNTIRLTERNVSRRHARLVRQNGAIFVEDLASFTGVRVNGARVSALTPVREGDEVQIGDYKLMLRAERPPIAVDGDRATMPSMPAALGPMATVGGSVAIPTRATAAVMAAQASVNGPASLTPRSTQSPFIAAAAPAPAPFAAAAPGAPDLAMEGGVPDPLEAQPTIPVRTLGEAPFASPNAEASPPARLVVLTTELASMEFALNRASVVIGRTDENEIVLNHRSISRHHAKIVREGDHYTIVDLQSANGVRVNGEDYERIELHAADVVELGHVKLRFVGPFEHYVFDPSARYDRGRFPTKIAIVAGAAAMAAVAVFAVLRGARPHISEAVTSPALAPVAAGAAAATSPPPAPPPAATPPAPGQAQATPQSLLAEAVGAAGSEDWEAARAALDRLGTQVGDPAIRRQAIDLRRRVDTERQGALAFAKFDEAQTAKNYAEAMARYGDIPSDSVYKRRARPRVEEARALLVAEHLTAAEKARGAGHCAEARQEAEEVESLDPRNTLAKEIVRLCRPRAEPVAAAPRPSRPKPTTLAAQTSRAERSDRAERVEPVAVKRAEPVAETEADPEAMMKQARDAWLRQQCGSAIDLSRKALRARPGLTDAYQIIAVCSCSLKDAEGASRAYARLDDKSRNLVRSLCQKNGIVVGTD